MATIHEITEDWQREGLSPTWVKLQQAQAEFDALQKQMESQKDEWLSWQAKREALEKDAARYRWLCEHQIVPSPSLWDDGIGFVCKLNGLTRRGTVEKATLDAAIAKATGEQQ